MAEPETQARPDIVALLCDVDFAHRRETRTWSHRDGRPFSKEERDLVLSATRAELQELHDQFAGYREYRRTLDESEEAMQRFLAPYMDQLPDKNLGNAHQLMNDEARAEFDRLLARLMEPVRPFAPYMF